jgi:ATP-dependent RNA helicase RhlE
MPFRSLGLDPEILLAVRDAGYTQPTPIQVSAIPPIMAGQDLIGIAQTGTGKTAAFALPILSRITMARRRPGTCVLILVPTRELAIQIKENIQAYAKYMDLGIATVFGGVGEHPQMKALKMGCEIIIACPGRLMDLMRRHCADFSNLQFLVLDEADRMLDMGFLPDIKRIIQTLPKERQTLMFSATLSRDIEVLTHDFQRNPKLIEVGKRTNPAATVTQYVYEVPKHLKGALLLHLLQDPAMQTVLVFARMKHATDKIARYLDERGVRTAAMHSGRSQSQRQKALGAFKEGHIRVLVATDIAARGIDVSGITHVVNYDFPMHKEDYIHRIGRTGRAEEVGEAISFVTSEDRDELRNLERFIGREIPRQKAAGFDYMVAATQGANYVHARHAHSTSRQSFGHSPHRPHAGGQGRSQGAHYHPRGSGSSPSHGFRRSSSNRG